MDLADSVLIDSVRRAPALYNPSCADFKFSDRKEKVWINLSANLGTNVLDAKRRWTCLRDRYTRELKGRKKNKKYVSPTGSNVFFESMDFLRPYVRKRRERNSLTIKADPSENSWNEISKQHNIYQNGMTTTRVQKTNSWAQHLLTLSKDEVAVDKKESSEQIENLVETEMSEDVIQEYIQENAEFVDDEDYVQYDTCPIEEDSNDTSPKKMHFVDDDSSVIGTHSTGQGPLIIPQICTPEEHFCKSISGYLENMSTVNQIKAKVEIYQILVKYVELDEHNKQKKFQSS